MTAGGWDVAASDRVLRPRRPRRVEAELLIPAGQPLFGSVRVVHGSRDGRLGTLLRGDAPRWLGQGVSTSSLKYHSTLATRHSEGYGMVMVITQLY